MKTQYNFDEHQATFIYIALALVTLIIGWVGLQTLGALLSSPWVRLIIACVLLRAARRRWKWVRTALGVVVVSGMVLLVGCGAVIVSLGNESGDGPPVGTFHPQTGYDGVDDYDNGVADTYCGRRGTC